MRCLVPCGPRATDVRVAEIGVLPVKAALSWAHHWHLRAMGWRACHGVPERAGARRATAGRAGEALDAARMFHVERRSFQSVPARTYRWVVRDARTKDRRSSCARHRVTRVGRPWPCPPIVVGTPRLAAPALALAHDATFHVKRRLGRVSRGMTAGACVLWNDGSVSPWHDNVGDPGRPSRHVQSRHA